VKRTLLAPVLLLANTVLFFLLIAGFVTLYEPTVATVLHQTGPVLLMALFPAVMFTVLRSLFKAIVPVLFLFLVCVTSALILTGAVLVHHPGGGVPLPDPALQRRLPTGVILSGGDVSVRIDDATGVILTDLLLVYHREVPAIRVVPEATWHAGESRIVLPDGKDVDSTNFSEVLWWQIPPAVRSLATDGMTLFRMLAGPLYSGRTIELALMWSAFLLALTAVWTTARLFRWPLLNLAVSVAYLRGILALPESAEVLVRSYPLPRWMPDVVTRYPVVPAWALAALVLLVIAVFLPPLNRWQREMVDGEGDS
jgi:hypothetical protein